MTDFIFNREKTFDVVQGIDEEIPYGFIVTEWGTSPSSVVVVAKILSTLVDVTDTLFPDNSPVVDGDLITLSLLKAITEGVVYRIEVKFNVDGGGKVELFGIVRAQL